MILVDHSSVCLWCLFGRFKDISKIEEISARDAILQAYNRIASRFKAKYGDVVMCLDDRTYWRTEVFPNYKAKRKKEGKDKEAWNVMWSTIRKIQDEMRENMPYRFMQVATCEADDVIGVLAPKLAAEGKPVVIVSSDKDFIQLLGDGVDLWSPKEGVFIPAQAKEGFLENLILHGDDGDGVPNVYSDDDVFVTGKRQVPIVESRKVDFAEMTRSSFMRYDPHALMGEDYKYDKQLSERYWRNKKLVDLAEIPYKQKIDIVEAWGFERGKAIPKDSGKIMRYLIASGNGDLVESIAGF